MRATPQISIRHAAPASGENVRQKILDATCADIDTPGRIHPGQCAAGQFSLRREPVVRHCFERRADGDLRIFFFDAPMTAAARTSGRLCGRMPLERPGLLPAGPRHRSRRQGVAVTLAGSGHKGLLSQHTQRTQQTTVGRCRILRFI